MMHSSLSTLWPVDGGAATIVNALKLHDPDFPLRLLPPYSTAAEERFTFFRTHLPPTWRTANQPG